MREMLIIYLLLLLLPVAICYNVAVAVADS
jgi:hypothetical protein